jgi:GNAT superfamily N-acetyltransferase
MITIKEKDLDSFFEVPFNIYQSGHFVSLFKDDIKRFLSTNNPLFRNGDNFTYITAHENGKAIGRIVCLIHEAGNVRHNLHWAYFGYFDCVDRLDVAKALMDHATKWARDRGFNEIVGNINFTFMQQIGVMVEGFENFPYSDQVYSPSYLPKLLEELGFESFFPMVTSETKIDNIDMKVFEKEKIKLIENDPDYTFKEVGYFGIKKFMKDGCQVLNEGFDKNPYFTPITLEEFEFQAKDLMLVIDPGLTILAYHKERPVGVIICIPDLNPLLHSIKSRLNIMFFLKFLWFKIFNDRAVIIFYSVSPDFHGKGLNQAILKRVIKNLKKKKYKTMGITWIADVNKSSLRQMEIISAKVLHKLNLFKKKI